MQKTQHNVFGGGGGGGGGALPQEMRGEVVQGKRKGDKSGYCRPYRGL